MTVTTFASLNAHSTLTHGVFSRHGGSSPPPFDSLNVSYGVGDDVHHVRQNRQRIKDHLRIERLISARQIHGDRIKIVEEKPAIDQEYEGYDALVTTIPGIGLMIQQADCQAVILADSKRRVVANIHAGWRGSVAAIIPKTVSLLCSQFGSRKEEIQAAISPSLGPCCAEFINYTQELPSSFHPFQSKETFFDFWKISREQLQSAGINPSNIETASSCTVCNNEYFSYRREKLTGRFATVVGIRGVN